MNIKDNFNINDTKASNNENDKITIPHQASCLSLDVRVENETIWSTQTDRYDIVPTTKHNITLHVSNASPVPSSPVSQHLTGEIQGNTPKEQDRDNHLPHNKCEDSKHSCNEIFWTVKANAKQNKSIKFNLLKLLTFLEKNGFRSNKTKDGCRCLVRIDDNVIQKCDIYEVRRFVLNHLRNLTKDEVLHEKFADKIGCILSKANLYLLKEVCTISETSISDNQRFSLHRNQNDIYEQITDKINNRNREREEVQNDKQSLKKEMGDTFLSWAESYFSLDGGNINKRLPRKKIFADYLSEVKLGSTKPTSKSFKKKLLAFCEYSGYHFNIHKRNEQGEEFIDYNRKSPDETFIGVRETSGGTEYIIISTTDYFYSSSDRER